MSYIRCTSNPENLYVWHDIDGNVYWSTGGDMNPMPADIFEGLMRYTYSQYEDYQQPGGLYFKEGDHCANIREKDFGKIIVTYWHDFNKAKPTWQVEMWLVTFYYIYNNWRNEYLRYHARELWWSFKSWFQYNFYYRWIPE